MHSMQEHDARWERLWPVTAAGWGRCRASHQGSGWLATFDKLALRSAAFSVYKNTDSKQCSSALDLRPGKSLTRAHRGKTSWRIPGQGPELKWCDRVL